jgi:Dolichyl-phosphate-mannose-protein mannosyltransferase
MPDEILSTPAARRRFWLAVGLLALALQGALLWLEWRPEPRRLWGDEITYWDAAAQVRAGQTPDLHLLWPPFYPRFLAVLMPVSNGSRLAAQLVQIVLLAIAAICLRGLGRALFPARAAAADIAAALLVLDPQVAVFTVYLWPELLHLALFLFAWWALATRADRWPWLVAAGGALGLALLTKSLLVPFVPVLLAPLVLAGPPRQRLLRPALVLGTLMLVILPTLLAHRARYGVAVIADSSLFNAWVGLNDRARRSFVDEIVGDEYGLYLQSAPDPRGRDAVVRAKIAGLVEERGVWRLLRAQLGRQYFRLFHHDSFFTEQLPGGGIAAVQGYGYLAPPGWLATALRVWAAALYGGVLIAAALAVATVPATEPGVHRGWLAVAVLFVVYNLALFLVLHVMSRYRVQFMPVLDLGAGATVVWVWRSQPRRPAVAWVAGGVLAASLIFLAFGGQ